MASRRALCLGCLRLRLDEVDLKSSRSYGLTATVKQCREGESGVIDGGFAIAGGRSNLLWI